MSNDLTPNTEYQLIPYQNTRPPEFDAFVDAIAHKYFKAVFSAFDLQITDLGQTITSEKDLDIFKTRYQEMTKALQKMMGEGFHLINLSLIFIKGNSGVQFKYQDRTGRFQTNQYISGGKLSDLISPDFLHDLKHIPLRQEPKRFHHG